VVHSQKQIALLFQLGVVCLRVIVLLLLAIIDSCLALLQILSSNGQVSEIGFVIIVGQLGQVVRAPLECFLLACNFLLQFGSEPVQSFFQSLSRERAASLNLPVVILDFVQAVQVRDLCSVSG